jgi:hypothetical protein
MKTESAVDNLTALWLFETDKTWSPVHALITICVVFKKLLCKELNIKVDILQWKNTVAYNFHVQTGSKVGCVEGGEVITSASEAPRWLRIPGYCSQSKWTLMFNFSPGTHHVPSNTP